MQDLLDNIEDAIWQARLLWEDYIVHRLEEIKMDILWKIDEETNN